MPYLTSVSLSAGHGDAHAYLFGLRVFVLPQAHQLYTPRDRSPPRLRLRAERLPTILDGIPQWQLPGSFPTVAHVGYNYECTPPPSSPRPWKNPWHTRAAVRITCLPISCPSFKPDLDLGISHDSPQDQHTQGNVHFDQRLLHGQLRQLAGPIGPAALGKNRLARIAIRSTCLPDLKRWGRSGRSGG